jgi:hypothetical protein
MALRLRRGTNAERLTIIPQEGELIYTTDTKELYAGDGSTIGGLRVTGSTEGSPAALTQDLDLASNNITGIGSIDITGTVTANFDGDVIGNVLGDVQGSVFGDDSTLIVDAINNTLTGNLTGDVFGNDGTVLVDSFNSILLGELIGNVTGDVQGSVFGDDSTILIDSVNNKINLDGTINGTIRSNVTDDFTRIVLARNSASDISSDDVAYGSIQFKRNDINGEVATALISGGNGYVLFATATSGTFGADKFIAMDEGNLSIGGFTPTARLDVRGDIKAASSISPGVYADDTARDTAIPVPAAGMMIFNTTGTKFQGYTGSAWVDLN